MIMTPCSLRTTTLTRNTQPERSKVPTLAASTQRLSIRKMLFKSTASMSKGSTSSLPHPPHRVLLKRSTGKMRKMLDIGMLLSMLASR
jgi:hypothetical protein